MWSGTDDLGTASLAFVCRVDPFPDFCVCGHDALELAPTMTPDQFNDIGNPLVRLNPEFHCRGEGPLYRFTRGVEGDREEACSWKPWLSS